MKIGIIAFLHESNTFSSQPASVTSFKRDLFVKGEAMQSLLSDSHHEVGGFFAGLKESHAEPVPLFAARALPCGTIDADAFEDIVSKILNSIENAGHLDGLLVAPHGATVSENHEDADGFWLDAVKNLVGENVPLVGTLDAHANLSSLMVKSCQALVAYRTNPHLDQRTRGIEAASLLTSTLRGEINPVMEARFPPLAIRIDQQCTDELPLRKLYDFANDQKQVMGALSNSILLGFPYADVPEMGSSVIVVTDDRPELAARQANDLAMMMWGMREEFEGEFTSIDNALAICAATDERVCLLDMGDNVGGGSSADGTHLLAALLLARIPRCFVCLYDPEAVQKCEEVGNGQTLVLPVGGKTDDLHGDPITIEVSIRSFHEGEFSESQPRHGGIVDFDQGRTVVCTASTGLTLMLTSRRMVPFSKQQLISCDLDPHDFDIIVAKGVNAPIAAYQDVCQKFIRVNTPGSTCSDMTTLEYQNRRRPMFPFEKDAKYLGVN